MRALQSAWGPLLVAAALFGAAGPGSWGSASSVALALRAPGHGAYRQDGAYSARTSGPLISTARLRLSARTLAVGETLTASITLKNATRETVGTKHIVVAARPPGGTKEKGPFDDFGRVDNRSLAPGTSITVRMTRTFGPSDPPGRWFVFALYETVVGHWYAASPDVYFTLTPGIVVTKALHLSASRVSRGGTLSASITLRNRGTHTLTLRTVDIAARPPGGTKSNGPFDDFGTVSNVRLHPGQSMTVTKSRIFGASDPFGRWYVYAVAQLTDGTWESLSRDLYFTVISGSW